MIDLYIFEHYLFCIYPVCGRRGLGCLCHMKYPERKGGSGRRGSGRRGNVAGGGRKEGVEEGRERGSGGRIKGG